MSERFADSKRPTRYVYRAADMLQQFHNSHFSIPEIGDEKIIEGVRYRVVQVMRDEVVLEQIT